MSRFTDTDSKYRSSSTLLDTDSKYRSSSTLLKIRLNLLLLGDFSAYMNYNSLLTAHIQRKIIKDKHRGKVIVKLIENIYGGVEKDGEYLLVKASCGQKGVKVVYRMLINVYRRIRILVRMLT